MSFATFAKSVRNFRNHLEIDANVRLGREFIPTVRDELCIETSSICNLECRFCAYVKKASPTVSTANEVFADRIDQAVEIGFRRFQLTPCTGEVFMDREIFDKLAYLDQHPGVDSYEFFTNFTIPNREQVERLLQLDKLKQLTISIYGHDLESFIAVTGSTEKVHDRLVANLETLLACMQGRRFRLAMGFRSTKKVPRGATSELLRLMKRYREAGIHVSKSRVYNNWGGYVTQDDVRGLDIDITGDNFAYKKGACLLLFTQVQVMATGIVNGCACRDVDATLRIGDIHEAPLKEILSTANPAYLQLIREQQEGHFRPVCQACDFYKSIYHKRSHSRRTGELLQSLEGFMATGIASSRAEAAPPR